ncbi:MAG: glycosyltransferase [Candidatus Woesebacteria bacterium]|nr:glycosyltransferase [Candidatus Woesebacteria bacterium]
MKVSICITIKDEEKWIGALLDSLALQSKKADEIVIVDGGSTDKTVEIIKHYQKKNRNIKLLVEEGGIAHGRNTAIEIAKYPIIVQIDAGCIAEKDWLEKLVRPFELSQEPEAGVGVSAGFYIMPSSSFLQKAMNLYLGIHPKRFDPANFLPSARSVAFKKEVWEKVGGYDESLEKGGEDTKFFISCVKTGIRIARVGDAKVIWEETAGYGIKNFFLKIFNYAKGDAKTKLWIYPIPGIMSHNIKILFVFIRYLLGLGLLIISFTNPPFFYFVLGLFVLYIFWSVWKFRDICKSWQVRVWIPIVQIVSDIAVMLGFLYGIL